VRYSFVLLFLSLHRYIYRFLLRYRVIPVLVRLSVGNRGVFPCSSVRKGFVSLLYGKSPDGAYSGIVKAPDPSVSLYYFLSFEYAVYIHKIKERL
jgi:hypothetical protein